MTNATLDRIDARLGRLDPESLRYRLLAALRQFRASWVDLGRLLNQVALDGDYKEWGYDDFDVYCARELGLKRPTVQKLMVSYNYMRRHESERLHGYEDAAERPRADTPPFDIPDYQTVELLDRARRRAEDGAPGLDEAAVERFHRRAFRLDAPSDASGADGGEADADDETRLRQELRDRLRPAARGGPTDEERDRAALLRLSRALRLRLAASPRLVPDGLRRRLEEALAELEEIQPA